MLSLLRHIIAEEPWAGTILSGLIASAIYSCIVYFSKGSKSKSEPDLSERIKSVSSAINKSSKELMSLQSELEKQVKYVSRLNEEAKQSQAIIDLSHEQIAALKEMLNQDTKKSNKKSWWLNLLVTFIFFVLGLVWPTILHRVHSFLRIL